MSGDMERAWQDLLVVVFLVALRIGVPALILFAVGAWLKHILEPSAGSALPEGAKERKETKMDTNILNALRDVLVVGYMFVIRVAVPIMLVLLWGAALKKRMEQSAAHIESAESLPGGDAYSRILNRISAAVRTVFAAR